MSYQAYDHFVEQHEAAYAAFKAIYVQKSPPPERQKAKREHIISLIALGFLVSASVIVSGSRTIAEFGGGVVGASAFVMLELGIVTYAYVRTNSSDLETNRENVLKLLKRGLWLAFLVALAANLHHTLKGEGFQSEIVDVVIAGLLAIGAPTLALISGDVAAMLVAMDRASQREADALYDQALADWKDSLNASWNANKSRWGIRIEVEPEPVRLSSADGQTRALPADVRPSDQADGRGHATGQGYNKRTDARTTVQAHFDAHPEDVNLTVREIAEKLGVGKTTVADVLRENRALAASTNGHRN